MRKSIVTFTFLALLSPATIQAQCQLIIAESNQSTLYSLAPGSPDPKVITTAIRNPQQIALDRVGSGALYVNSANGVLYRSTLDGSSVTFYSPDYIGASAIAVDSVNRKLYWSQNVFSSGAGAVGTGKIQRGNLDGSGIETFLDGLNPVLGLAIDTSDNMLYWSDSIGLNASLRRQPLSGGSTQTLSTLTGYQDQQKSFEYFAQRVALDLTQRGVFWGALGILAPNTLTVPETSEIQKISLDDLSVTHLASLGARLEFGRHFYPFVSGLSASDGAAYAADTSAFQTIRRIVSTSPFTSNNVLWNDSGTTADVLAIPSSATQLCAQFPASSLSIPAVVFRPLFGGWYQRYQQHGYLAASLQTLTQWGLPGDWPLLGDADYQGRDSLRVWRKELGNWYGCNEQTQFGYTGGRCAAANTLSQFGLPGDYPLDGDFDGDNKKDLVVWRPRSGNWYVTQSSNSSVVTKQWGLPNDYPVPGDFDGDSITDFAVWRPLSGTWYVLLSSRNFDSSQPLIQQWGLPEDHPISADLDGDGKTDLVVWRPSNGTWYVCGSATQFQCTTGTAKQFGLRGDVPLKMDFDKDGRDDYVVYRPALGMWFYLNSASNEFASQQWGLPDDIPLGADIRTMISINYPSRPSH